MHDSRHSKPASESNTEAGPSAKQDAGFGDLTLSGISAQTEPVSAPVTATACVAARSESFMERHGLLIGNFTAGCFLAISGACAGSLVIGPPLGLAIAGVSFLLGAGPGLGAALAGGVVTGAVIGAAVMGIFIKYGFSDSQLADSGR